MVSGDAIEELKSRCACAFNRAYMSDEAGQSMGTLPKVGAGNHTWYETDFIVSKRIWLRTLQTHPEKAITRVHRSQTVKAYREGATARLLSISRQLFGGGCVTIS